MTPVELTCPDCQVTLVADSVVELADVVGKHELSIHERQAVRQHVLSRIGAQNR